MTTQIIETANHPRSGETYAVRRVGGVIVAAAGPLSFRERTDVDSLEEWLFNNADTAEEDGRWLQREIDKANGN